MIKDLLSQIYVNKIKKLPNKLQNDLRNNEIRK